SFAFSYRDLDAAAARMFRRLGLVAGTNFGADVAAVLAESSPGEAEALLESLVDVHLLETAPTAGRYRFHDLLRLYARERVREEESERERKGALGRMLEWYLDTARAAAQLLQPGRSLLRREGEGERR